MKEIFLHSVKKRLYGAKCPQCGNKADGATGLDDNGNYRDPKPGDWVVCIYCGTINRYGRGLVLFTPSRKERRALARDPRMRRLVEIAADASRAYRRQWQ